MSPDQETQAVIRVASRELQLPALMLLLADEPQGQRLERVAAILRTVRREKRYFDELLVARRDQELVGVVWGQLMPGSTAVVWPPRLVTGEQQPTAASLLTELDMRLQRRGVQLIQAVLKESCDADASQLRCLGFQHTVDLLFLLCQRAVRQSAPATGSLEFETYDGSQRQRMLRLIEATYVETLDVPQLNGVRDMHDVLEGYEQTGAAGAAHWFFARADGADVGCLLLADHPDQRQWELVYMGVTPSARGHGWGQIIVEFAQWQAAHAGPGRLVLAVDADNEPALRIYAAAGFVQCERRAVFLKISVRDPFSRGGNQFRQGAGGDTA